MREVLVLPAVFSIELAVRGARVSASTAFRTGRQEEGATYHAEAVAEEEEGG